MTQSIQVKNWKKTARQFFGRAKYMYIHVFNNGTCYIVYLFTFWFWCRKIMIAHNVALRTIFSSQKKKRVFLWSGGGIPRGCKQAHSWCAANHFQDARASSRMSRLMAQQHSAKIAWVIFGNPMYIPDNIYWYIGLHIYIYMYMYIHI